MNRSINRAIYLKYKKAIYSKPITERFVDMDKAYGNQCVDLIRHYCKTARNYEMGKLPSAKDANTTTTFPGLKSLVVGTDELWSGDIIITGPTKFNPHGHISICDTVIIKVGPAIMEQNGKGGGTQIKGNEIRVRRTRRGNILKVFRFVKYG